MKNGDPVLNILRSHRDSFLSGEEISKLLKVSRAAVWKDIQHLRALGYEIEAQPHHGYRLVAVADKLFADELSLGLKARVVGRQIFSYETIGSTNDAAFKLGEDGVGEGACVFAEYQTQGRGRLGRQWQSPKGKNILFSVMLKPSMLPAEVPKLTLAAAVSVVRTVEGLTHEKPGIKWPNDIYYKGKKLCGILTEMSAESDRVRFVVVGIGLNVNCAPDELPAGSTSLAAIMGHRVDRLEFARSLLKRLDADYARFCRGEHEALAHDWEELSVTSGKRVAASVLDRTVQGTAMGIDADGALWIRKDNGIQERIVAGDVKHLD